MPPTPSIPPADSPAPAAPAPSGPAAEVTAVVVTYHPDPQARDQQFDALLQQVDRVVVVDNTPGGAAPVTPNPRLTVLRQQCNVGLATAQNIGLQQARKGGARFVMLFDQDSLPASGMVAALLHVYRQAQAMGLPVAAVGPQVEDAAGRVEGFVRFGGGRYEAIRPDAGQNWLRCDMLIASGTLIPIHVLDRIGDMDESLFIDRIDFEWCLRALGHGLVLLGAAQARLHHRLGERQRRVWFLGWRCLPVHLPFRYYYMVRNSLLVRRLPHASAAWRQADRRQLLSLLLYFGLLLPGRLATLGMMARGWRDGRRGLGGPLPP